MSCPSPDGARGVGPGPEDPAAGRDTCFVRATSISLAAAVTVCASLGPPVPAASVDQEPRSLSPVVFVVGFPSYGRPLQDYDTMSRALIADLERATSYHGYDDPGAPPFLRYRLYGDGVVVDDVPPPVLANGNADYADVYARHRLCDLISEGEVDEVWFIVAGAGNGTTLGHMPEWATNGDGWSSSRFYGTALSVNLPNCGRTVTTMMYHYGLDLGFALHSFAHRCEGFFMTHVPCEFITESWPWQGRHFNWLDRCPDLDRDRYAFVARPSAANGQVAACGDVHAPPNRTSDEAYVYDDSTSARSMCGDWSLDGSAAIRTVDCRDWGCSQHGYMTWWMQNVPGLDNTNRDAGGRRLANWWPLLFQGPTAEVPPTPTPGPPPVPQVLFEDRFEVGRDPRWADWDFGGVPVERGVAAGVLSVSALGAETVSHVTGLLCSDCDVEARVSLAVQASTHDERAAGLVLGVEDPGELILAHLRLAKATGIDTTPSVSLWRRRNHAWSLLAETGFALQADRWYALRLRARGEWLEVSVDGSTLLRTRAGNIPPAGSAGIRVSQALARYDDFVVLGFDHLHLTPTATPTPTPGLGTVHPPSPTVTQVVPEPTVDAAYRIHLPVAARPVEPEPATPAGLLGSDDD